jgi:hypothetical protein
VAAVWCSSRRAEEGGLVDLDSLVTDSSVTWVIQTVFAENDGLAKHDKPDTLMELGSVRRCRRLNKHPVRSLYMLKSYIDDFRWLRSSRQFSYRGLSIHVSIVFMVHFGPHHMFIHCPGRSPPAMYPPRILYRSTMMMDGSSLLDAVISYEVHVSTLATRLLHIRCDDDR